MIQSKNKLYVGSKRNGYLCEQSMTILFDYLAEIEMYEVSKAKPIKIKDSYLLEIEINDKTKELIHSFKTSEELKLYKRTHTWKEIYKM